jgi:hypothetical protein
VYAFGRGSGTIDEDGNSSGANADSIFDRLTFKTGVGPTDLLLSKTPATTSSSRSSARPIG